jgi:hypothetical protein
MPESAFTSLFGRIYFSVHFYRYASKQLLFLPSALQTETPGYSDNLLSLFMASSARFLASLQLIQSRKGGTAAVYKLCSIVIKIEAS